VRWSAGASCEAAAVFIVIRQVVSVWQYRRVKDGATQPQPYWWTISANRRLRSNTDGKPRRESQKLVRSAISIKTYGSTVEAMS